MGEEGLRSHEEGRKPRQADVGHGIDRVAALPLVRKGRADAAQAVEKLVENERPDGESEFRQSRKRFSPLALTHLELLASERQT